MTAIAYAPPRAGPFLLALFDRFEGVAVGLILFLMSGALLAPLLSPDQMPDTVPILRQLWLPAFALIVLLIARRPLLIAKVAAPALLCFAMVGWTFLSARWSIQPDVSFRRAVALTFTTLFALHLAARYGWKTLMEMFAALFGALAVGTAIVSVVFPGMGANDPVHPGAWNGLWYEKNQMGGLMAHGALATACAAWFAPERRKLWAGALAFCLLAVVMSQSTTALVASAVDLGGLAAVLLLRAGGWIGLGSLWVMVTVGGAFAGVMAFAPDLFFGLLGKDSSLTGRTDIWAAVLRQVEHRPLGGYGFGAVWTDPWGPAWFIRHEVKWEAPTAHNGWLDVLLQLGAVGLALCALHFLASAGAAVVRLFRGAESAWAAPFIAVFGLLSVSESTLLQYNGLPWMLYLMLTAKLFETGGLAAAPATPRAPHLKLFPDP